MAERTAGEIAFVRRVLIALAIVALALFAWRIVDVLLLAFGAVLVAVLLRAAAAGVARVTPLAGQWAYAAALILILAALVLVGWLFGSTLTSEIGNLAASLPQAWQSLQERLDASGWGGALLDQAQADLGSGVLSQLGRALTLTAGGIANLLLILFGGLFLAASPGLYRKGVVALFPKSAHARVAETLDAAGNALRQWLLGQAVSMVIIGLLTWLGLWLIGVPAALGLGLFAGLMEFVPFVGPIVAAVPALLLALSQGTDVALWTVLLYLAIQQIEGNLVMPLVQRRMVSLPPALTLFAVVAAGLVFGFLGIVFATPLTVVAYVAVKKLYVRETLGETTTVPGERR